MKATTANCPRCHAPVYFGMKRCPYCGAEILFEEMKGKFVVREGDPAPPTFAIRDIQEKDGVRQIEGIEFKPILYDKETDPVVMTQRVPLMTAKKVEYVTMKFSADIFDPKPPPGPRPHVMGAFILLCLILLGITAVIMFLRGMI